MDQSYDLVVVGAGMVSPIKHAPPFFLMYRDSNSKDRMVWTCGCKGLHRVEAK
jgi:hypothetical protein